MTYPALNNNNNNNSSWGKSNLIQLLQLVIVVASIIVSSTWYLSSMASDIKSLSKQNDLILNSINKNQEDFKAVASLVTKHDKSIDLDAKDISHIQEKITSIEDVIEKLESKKK